MGYPFSKKFYTILGVEELEDDSIFETGYDMYLSDGSYFILDKKYGVIPKIDDDIILYLLRTTEVYGVYLNGKKVFLKTMRQLKEGGRI